MNTLSRILVILSFPLFCSCSSRGGKQDKANAFYPTNDEFVSGGIEDGEHDASVIYHNTHTGKRSKYYLKVEVEDNELKCIYWPNGGTLDESHFDPPDISDGSASFISDKGYIYSVYIED